MLAEYAAAAGLERVEPQEITLAFGRRAKASRGISFAFQRKTAEALDRARWPGNVRQLELVVESAVVSALADALRAPRSGREVLRVIPVGAKLVRDLIQAGDAMGGPEVGERSDHDVFEIGLRAAPSLREVSRDVEMQYFKQLYSRTKGDFSAMAGYLLGERTERAARKVRLRFNQLGLKVRDNLTSSK